MTKYETSAALNVFEIKFTTDDKDAALRVQDLCKEEVERAQRETIKEKVLRFSERAELPKKPGIISRLKSYLAAIKWLWKHRDEPNNRHKWRRMMREVKDG